ncbi:hypothetical protein [Sansalvadorimonas verongulae]|uniref:hypothetical protein n=1 Tax=Sansalvadorimonas verongulae TaxID=2172824 RepID=UPI0012BCF1B1|nr:hypothetical protein [Sansalvadorimonas verongulae]MTI13675.1 hypothetical protein [Sansalvadorimonas verongulae]
MKSICLFYTLLGSLLAFHSTELQASDDCDNRSYTKAKGYPDWKIGGLIFGTHGQVQATQALEFKVGGHLPEDQGFYPKTVTLSLTEKPSTISKLLAQPSAVTISYGIFYLDADDASHTIIYNALDSTPFLDEFEQSNSFTIHGSQFLESCKIPRGRTQTRLEISGYVVQVERKGFSKFTRSCNVIVNTRGKAEEVQQHFDRYEERQLCNDNSDYFNCTTETVPIYKDVTVTVPNTQLLIAHSEEACAFAEDAGRARSPVQVEYSIRKFSISDPNRTKIHRITVQPARDP